MSDFKRGHWPEDYVLCPACGSRRVSTTSDWQRNLGVLRCDGCGEMYAFHDEDLREHGWERIFLEWRGSYMDTKRLEGGR